MGKKHTLFQHWVPQIKPLSDIIREEFVENKQGSYILNKYVGNTRHLKLSDTGRILSLFSPATFTIYQMWLFFLLMAINQLNTSEKSYLSPCTHRLLSEVWNAGEWVGTLKSITKINFNCFSPCLHDLPTSW